MPDCISPSRPRSVKTASFFQRNINELRRGGLSVLARKVRTLLLMILAVPALVLMRALRPFVLIRLEPLHSRRLGHFVCNTELYLCERDAGMRRRRAVDIFYHDLSTCNAQVNKMWQRTGKLRISPFALFTRILDTFNRLLPYGRAHVIATWDMDYYGLRAVTKPYLSFTPEEEESGRRRLKELGIIDGAAFVCFHARDAAYMDSVYPAYNWRYNDFKNSSIDNYLPAAEELARRGYFMIRMGAVVKKTLNVDNPRIIDYATRARTDFLDIYLGAKCRFFISDGCGISSVPVAFRRPVVWVNYVQLVYTPIWGPRDLFILKKLWSRKERRFLTLSEILNSDIQGFFKGEQYEQAGIEPIENTSQEIAAVSTEMDERLRGSWQASGEDEQLQQRFWSTYKARWPQRKVLSRIGAEFLRQNRDWLLG